jgi:NAD-dependent DNA ligase
MSTQQQKDYDQLVKYSDAYYNTDTPLISDQQFDSLVAAYEAKYNTKFAYLGTSVVSRTVAKLPVTMPSLAKCKDEKSLRLFCNKNTGKTGYVYSQKLDGISCLVTLGDKGNIQIFNRGDGKQGTDLSHLIPLIQFVPTAQQFKSVAQSVRSDNTAVFIRGELIIPTTLVAQLGKNLRNICNGACFAKTLDTEILKYVHFVAYSVLTKNQTVQPQLAFQSLFQAGIKIPLYRVVPECDLNMCNQVYDQFSCSTIYCMDGIVVSINQAECGVTESVDDPKLTIAFKRTGIVKQTKVLQVNWMVSRYGTAHPQVAVEPVEIDGCVISFASGFHAQYIFQNKIGPGAVVQIQRSGDVIPDIINVVTQAPEAQMPTQEYVWEGVHIKLDSKKEQEISRLVHSLKILEAKGISEASIQKFYAAGLINELILWNAKESDFCLLDGIKEKSAKNFVAALQQAKNNLTLSKLLQLSACFNNFGERKIEKIMASFDIRGYIQALYAQQNSVTTVQKVPQKFTDDAVKQILGLMGIHTQADAFLAGCKNFVSNGVMMQMFEMLVQQEPTPSVQITRVVPAGAGMFRVVFSGFRDKTLSEKCLQHNIQTSDTTVTKNTNILVVADANTASTKTAQATKLGVKIMTKGEFIAAYGL